MFQELAPMLEKRSLVLILTGLADGCISVNVVPKSTSDDKTDHDKALLQPLTLNGTPQELDADLPGILTEYKTAYLSMHESVTATKKQMADAKAAADAKQKAEADAKKNKGKTTTTVKPAETKKADSASPAAPGLFDAPAITTTEPEPDGGDDEDADEQAITEAETQAEVFEG